MLISVVKIYPLPGREDVVTDVLNSLKGPVSAIVDCLGCSVTREVGEAGVVCYMEQWRDRAALDRHLKSSLYSRVLEAMECSRQPPQVDFYEVTGVGGLELVAQARSGIDRHEDPTARATGLYPDQGVTR
jgi:quinol monooxygenase YgiN